MRVCLPQVRPRLARWILGLTVSLALLGQGLPAGAQSTTASPSPTAEELKAARLLEKYKDEVFYARLGMVKLKVAGIEPLDHVTSLWGGGMPYTTTSFQFDGTAWQGLLATLKHFNEQPNSFPHLIVSETEAISQRTCQLDTAYISGEQSFVITIDKVRLAFSKREADYLLKMLLKVDERLSTPCAATLASVAVQSALPQLPSATRPHLIGTSAPVRKDSHIAPSLGVYLNLPMYGPRPINGSLRVDFVSKGRLAETLGLRLRDTLISINDQPVDQDHPIRPILSALHPGDPVVLEILRDGNRLRLSGVLPAERHLDNYVFHEDSGLPGVIELGERYDEVVRRLGEPESLHVEPHGLDCSWGTLGIFAHFSGRGSRCDTLQVGFPYIGQTLLGLPSDGTKEQADRIYGKPWKQSEFAAEGGTLCEYAQGYFSLGFSSKGKVTAFRVTNAPKL